MNTEEKNLCEISEDNVQNNNQPKESDSDKRVEKKDGPRFEFALFVGDFMVIRKPIYNMRGYIEHSMQSQEFNAAIDSIVYLIKEDMNAKSRIYTWFHYFYPMRTYEKLNVKPEDAVVPEEFTEPLAPEGMFTFKFVVYDNRREVYTRIWDGRAYPNWLKYHVDITNRVVKKSNPQTKESVIFDKDEYFYEGRNLSTADYILHAMIMDRPNLVPQIQDIIVSVCTPNEGLHDKIADYQVNNEYRNVGVKRDADGNVVYKPSETCPWIQVPEVDKKHPKPGKVYNFNLAAARREYERSWADAVRKKTELYDRSFYERTFIAQGRRKH